MATIYWRASRRRWVIQYFDADGKRRSVTAPAAAKKGQVQALAVRLESEELDIRSGRADRYKRHRRSPADEALADYVAHLVAAGRSSEHVDKTRRSAEAVLEVAGWHTLEDLDAVGLTRFLRDQARAAPPVAPATRNHYRWAVYGWAKWLVEAGRLPANPFAAVRPARVTDRRERRALTRAQLAALLEAARTRQAAQYKAPHRIERARREGADRAMLYLMAATTGLRKGELQRLTWADIDLEGRSVRVRDSSAKSRKEQSVPLPGATAEALRAWRHDREQPFRVVKDLHRHFERDCTAAGIPKTDASGRVVDFHALRVTFVTELARAGVHPAIAQRLARHSTMEMTLKHYTDIRVADDAAAVESAWGSQSDGLTNGCTMAAPTPRARRVMTQNGDDAARQMGDASG